MASLDMMALLWTAATIGAGGICWFVRAMRKQAVDLEKTEPVTDGIAQPNCFTYVYEWVRGQSIHCYPSVPGKSSREAARIHEERVVDLIGARPGQRIVDVGCGVGGPMRAIARKSGAKVVGITIGEYQAKRARAENKKAGLDAQCEVVIGNFFQMPFDDGSFDGAYSIEASCCAPNLEDVYAEVFRVLKPGGMFAPYEFVTTEFYEEAKDRRPELAEAVEKLARLSRFPRFRAYHEIAEAARKVGFEVVGEKDLARPPSGPWWSTTIKIGRVTYWRNRLLFSVLAFMRILPKNAVAIHESLRAMTQHLSAAGEAGVFSPMYVVVCRKPPSQVEDEKE